MRRFVTGSASKRPGDKIEVTPFRMDQRLTKEPSEFEVTFILDRVRYQYGFAATQERIHNEWLLAYPLGKAQRWFERTWDAKHKKYEWVFTSANLKGKKNELAQETGQNKLFLSHAADRNHAQLTPIYTWFRNSLRTLAPGYDLNPVTEQYIAEAEGICSVVLGFLHAADFGISDIIVKERKVDVKELKPLVEGLPDSVKKELMSATLNRSRYEVRVKHRNPETQETVMFDLEDESDGTQRFFALIGPWVEALTFGYTVFVDELHDSLHPLLTRTLVDMFQDGKINRHGAQLVFTTHDVTLLDDELFRRDQIWFTEKDPVGASHLYSLHAYKEKPRKKGAWRKGYLAGRYGALPLFGTFGLGPGK